jgi:hypothetical protein
MRARWIARSLSAGALLVVALSACTAIVNDGDYKVANTCSVSIPIASCSTCFHSKCADSCNMCTADSPCLNAWSCSVTCAGDQTCTTGCILGLNAGSQKLITTMAQCLTNNCQSECTNGNGIGDGCQANTGCASNSCTSAGGWCTSTCSASNSICAGGHGSDGLKNEYGQLNWCIKNTGGSYNCFPGCLTAADCAPYTGTSCQSSTDATGTATMICSK